MIQSRIRETVIFLASRSALTQDSQVNSETNTRLVIDETSPDSTH
jgi:hypothetical protein